MRAMTQFWQLGVTILGDDECWPVIGRLTPKGYGQYWCDGKRHQSHVVAWELAHGRKVPEGCQVDHRCRARSCANPTHLEPVTPKVNTDRSPLHNGAKTHCPAGHDYAVYGRVFVRSKGPARVCTICFPQPMKKVIA